MIPKRIIEKAIEGGWVTPYPKEDEDIAAEYYWQETALDPSFWQSLGKVLGWGNCKPCHGTGYLNKRGDMPCNECSHSGWTATWDMRAKDFYDLILTDRDTEKFWEEILPSK